MRGAIRLVAEHPVSALMVGLAILLFGAVAFFRLKVEHLPDLAIPLVRVVTEYPGIPAEETEQLVTIPLENALSSVKGLKAQESVSKEGVSCVSLRFDWKTDPRTLTVDVREKIDSAYPYLPYGIRKPTVHSENLGALPILTLAALPKEGRSLTDISPIVRKDLASRLARIEGVASVRVAGIRELEVLVEAERGRIEGAGLSAGDLASLLSSSIFHLPIGTVETGGLEYLVKATTGIETVRAVARLPVSQGTGALTVGDLARVEIVPADPTSFFRLDGKEAVGVFVSKMPDAGSLNTARAVLEELPALRELFGRDFELRLVADGTEEIASALDRLLLSLALGTAATFVVLLFSFRNLAAPLVVAATVPLCLASVVLFLYFAGLTLNIVSLTGIAVGIGMIVDNSIVVTENLLARGARTPGEIAEAASEPAASIFASTATTVLVFLPVLYLPGMLGALFTELALTLAVLLAASFVLALSITPALYALLLPYIGLAGGRTRRTRAFLVYRKYLLLSLRRPIVPLSLLGATVLAGILSFADLPRRISPERDPGRVAVTAVFPAGTGVETASRESGELSRRLLELPCVKRVFAEGGFDAKSPRDAAESGRNSWTARFVILIGDDASASVPLVSGAFAAAGSLGHTVSLPQDTIGRLLGAGEESRFRLEGGDRETLLERAASLAARLGAKGLVASSSQDTAKELPRLLFVADDAALAHAEVSPRAVLDAIEASVRGTVAARLPRGEEELGIRVRLRKEETSDEAALGEIKAAAKGETGGAGGRVAIKELGRFARGLSHPELHRADRKTSVDLVFTPTPGRAKELERALAAESGGRLLSLAKTDEGGRHAALVFLIAVLLMYLVLGAQFESFAVPLLLLLAFPLSTARSFLGLAAYGYSLNLNSVLGILILLGTTINSTILLTDAYGKGGAGRIVRASLARLAPLGATVNTTLTALLPMLVFTRGENALQSNTAVALAGGLSLGTVTILLVYPCVYHLFGRRLRA